MRIAFVVAILAYTVSFPAAARQSSSARPHRQNAHLVSPSQPKAAEAPASLGPEQPLSPPPIVVYRDGSLSVTAQNSALQAVLDGIRESTGAAIEAPALEERVSVNLGPQPPVQVIAALLEGLHLDYAVLGGAGNEDPIRRLIVMRQPEASPPPSITPSPVLEVAKARTRAQALIHLEETGGDEGVWENDSQPSPPVVPRRP
jgi:hypothetical protein